MSGTHENFAEQSHRHGPSERSFGLVIACACAIFSFTPLLRHQPPRIWLLAVGAVMLAAALVRPSILRIPNRIWTGLGILLGKIINPVVTALLFYLIFTPVAVVLRWMGKDLLHLVIDRDAKTYWISRENDAASDMTNQF